MKKTVILKNTCLLFILLVVAQLTHGQPKITDAIDQLISKVYPADQPGAAVLVAKGDKLIFKKGYGKASMAAGSNVTSQTVFRIGSITKQFTSTAILKLISEGKIGLQDKIVKYLPAYQPQGELVTIENLLNHTSGITNYTSMLALRSNESKATARSTEQQFSYFSKTPLEYTPGEQFSYTNSGFFILGMIIEKVTGITYGEYLKKNIFDPLKMTSSYYDGGNPEISNRAIGYAIDETGIHLAPFVHHSTPYAAGALASNVEDLWKWNQGVFNFKIVPQPIMEKAWIPTTLNNGIKAHYGYGWALTSIDELKVIEHGGAIDGYLGYVLYVPEEKVFVTILTNSSNYECVNLCYDIARLVLNHPHKNPPTVSMSEQQLEEYAGNYKINDTRFRIIARRGNQLFSIDGNADTVEIFPFKTDGFFVKDVPERFEFQRDRTNKIGALTYTRNGWDTETGMRTYSLPTQKTAIPLDLSKFDEYVGVYEIAPGFEVKVWREERRFLTEATSQGIFEIFPESETRFFIKDVNAGLEFVKEDSKVKTVIVTIGKNSNIAKKIK
jgi:CubicO group peptidase (beta-lactamase class C family)